MSAELLGRSASELTRDLATRRIRATTKGVRTTFGAVPFANHVPSEDAICVERLRGPDWIGRSGAPR